MCAERIEYELAVLGAGSGGFAAARTAAREGLKVALIEGGRDVGGLCILRGCMPTKALLYAADVLHLSRRGAVWGLEPGLVGYDFEKVQARKDRMIEEFANYRRQQLGQGPFTFLREQARFLDEHTLALANGSELSARNFVIATGSFVSPPKLPGLKEVGYLTSDTALAVKQPPRSLIVLGGGPVAVELAQFFARFDVKVTLVQRSEHILKGLDDDVSEVVETALREEGITVFTGTRLIQAYAEGGLKGVVFAHQGQTVRVAAEEILYALGRTPNTHELGLENTGVFTENGRILANTEMQTTAPHIFVAGDCTGPHEIVHVAIQQGEIAAYNITHPARMRSMDYRLLCQVVFSEPQAAHVGLTEKEARAQGVEYLAAHYPFNDHGKSILMEALHGFVKLLADPRTGEILGGSVVGPCGGELIHEIVAAMHKRMTVAELATMPHYHPTLAEIWTYPAEELAEKVALQ